MTNSRPAATHGSVDPCPACGRRTLALERPPHLPVTGAQPYTELYRMGDLEMPVGVRCRTCGTAWPTIEALRKGEPGSTDPIDPVEGLEDDWAWTPSPGAPPQPAPGSAARGMVGAAIAVAAIAAGVVLLASGLLVPAMVLVMAAAMVWGMIRRRSR